MGVFEVFKNKSKQIQGSSVYEVDMCGRFSFFLQPVSFRHTPTQKITNNRPVPAAETFANCCDPEAAFSQKAPLADLEVSFKVSAPSEFRRDSAQCPTVTQQSPICEGPNPNTVVTDCPPFLREVFSPGEIRSVWLSFEDTAGR